MAGQAVGQGRKGRRFSAPNIEGFKRLLGLAWEQRAIFLVASTALVAASGLNLLIPEVVRRSLEPSRIESTLAYPKALILVLIAIFAAQGILSFSRSYLFVLMGQRVTADLRKRAFAAALRMELHGVESSGELASRLANDTALVQDAVGIRLSVVVRYLFQVVIGILLMAWMSWEMTMACALAIVFLVGISAMFSRELRERSKRHQSYVGKANSFAAEAISHLKVIRSLGAEPYAMRHFGSLADNLRDTALDRSRYGAVFAAGVSFALYTIFVLLFGIGLSMVADNSLSPDELAAFVLYGAIVAVSFGFLVGGYADLNQSLGGLDRVFQLIGSDRECEGLALHLLPPEKNEGRGLTVEFEDVSFRYPGKEEFILRGVSISIASGEAAAIVGPSGSGKSTAIGLILGFLKPDAGRILLNGSDVAAWDETARHRAIAWVPQEPGIFSVSVRENLLYARSDATQAELETVCRIAGCLEMIQGLPEGFDSVVGERGAALSGGERQRLAIARALLRRPRLLILDEATSGLDSAREDEIRADVRSFLPACTLIVISHRLSTIRRADRVFVMQNGSVVQTGTHETLKQEAGLYREYVERQSLEG